MKYWVIEAPTRGYFVGFDWNNNMEWVPRFRWSIPSSHDDVEKYFEKSLADLTLGEINKSHPRLQCHLRSFNTEDSKPKHPFYGGR